ncbi:uncharacterized protein B0H18DRAFT_79606 [Fomitopsis serialis]|uniref:uncharacterized protein n=1 Tax=Fomitopsis serialis TaxID=139415 RepID=UPI002008B1E1|nr:uncharacterized protein B0H18DRAFT_79606 [Neoantrodia serialis]KAH9915891.1 hypothetical protein B0H18DRAFT_79606 [Neoantrodia serialis]
MQIWRPTVPARWSERRGRPVLRYGGRRAESGVERTIAALKRPAGVTVRVNPRRITQPRLRRPI